MKFYPQEIVEITQAEMQKTGKAPFFEGVAIDSRSLKAGQLFVALKGERTDGHLFVKEAIKKGAPGVLVSRFEDGEEETYVFRVPDTFLALQHLGRGASQKLSGYKIAITGTVGKTTCKSFFASLLSRRFLVEATPQSFNTVIGVASSIANFKENNDYLIIEAGISKKKEMEELAEIIDPHMVVFTSFGEGHLEGLGSVEEVVEEKIKLVREKTEIIYLNTDQKWSGLVGEKIEGKKIISFGFSPANHIYLKSFSLDPLTWKAKIEIKMGENNFCFFAPFLFPEVAVMLLPAFHLACKLGIGVEEIEGSLRDWQPPQGRGNFFFYQGGIVIDDSYNANPLSSRKSLQFLDFLACHGFETWGVWGDMLELGGVSAEAHREFLRELKKSSLSRTLLVGEEMKRAAEEIAKEEIQEGRFLLFSTSLEVREFLSRYTPRGERWAILFKGSRKLELEKAIPPEWRENHERD
jgi:UDP-N-acetylmuramoyl-tripeptide--D-alanyl-D-alanine ligase